MIERVYRGSRICSTIWTGGYDLLEYGVEPVGSL
jgi:hypothetical protein